MLTLGDYRTMAVLMYGEHSKAAKFFADKIEQQGELEPVVADESQMLHLLLKLGEEGKNV